MNKKLIGGGIVGAVAILVAIGSVLPDDEPEAAATPTIEVTTGAPTIEEQDVTEQLKDAAGPDYSGFIHEATITEPGYIEVQTTIVDDREEGGDDADAALAICEVARVIMDAEEPHVSVLEADGTAFVLAGHPALGPSCVEY